MVFKCPSRLNHVKDPDVLIINRLADDNRSNEAYAVAGKGTANESYLLRVLYNIFPLQKPDCVKKQYTSTRKCTVWLTE